MSHRITVDDLGEEFQTFYKNLRAAPTAPGQSYMRTQQKLAEGMGLALHRMRIIAKTLPSGRFFSLAYENISRRFKRNLQDEYTALEREPDYTKAYVYFPLNYQPERTTSPQGGVYHDQILVAETLAAALPEGWELYVKEHPSQWWNRHKTTYNCVRYPGYYERIARIPRVRLVPIQTSSAELAQGSRAVATVTGSAGWESFTIGKPVLLFGYVWYGDCPGINKVRSVADCKAVFDRINDTSASNEKNILAFLKALETVSVRAYIEKHPEIPTIPDIPPLESQQALVQALNEAMVTEVF